MEDIYSVRFIRKILLSILSRKRIIILTFIWALGFSLAILADTDLFTKNLIKTLPKILLKYLFPTLIVLFMNILYWLNRQSFHLNSENIKKSNS